MFLMSRKIKSLGVKMVLSGEGADEIFGGYLYFHKAPNKEEFHQETCRKVTHVYFTFMGRKDQGILRCSELYCMQIKALHMYDCLRANKASSGWGVEVRVPFLDKEFINVAMGIDPEWKMVSTCLKLRVLAIFHWSEEIWICSDLILQIKPELGRIEKWILRRSFDDKENPYLPEVGIKHNLFPL